MSKDKLTEEELSQIRQVAEVVAFNAGKILQDYRGKARIVKTKSHAFDVASEADEASEKYIISTLKKNFPKHSFLAEESGQSKSRSTYRWIIDPLDGTKEFLSGHFVFGVNVALEYKGEIVAGSVCYPVVNELYSAALGLGTLYQGKPVFVSKQERLDDSYIAIHPPRRPSSKNDFNEALNAIGKLIFSSYRVRMPGFDILSLTMVARGIYDAFYMPINYPKWWDIAPGIIIVKEAGGVITTAKGNPLTENSFYQEGILASNGNIHKKLLKLIKEE